VKVLNGDRRQWSQHGTREDINFSYVAVYITHTWWLKYMSLALVIITMMADHNIYWFYIDEALIRNFLQGKWLVTFTSGWLVLHVLLFTEEPVKEGSLPGILIGAIIIIISLSGFIILPNY
jgi:hypothetical protein